jgi:hypothetical protein
MASISTYKVIVFSIIHFLRTFLVSRTRLKIPFPKSYITPMQIVNEFIYNCELKIKTALYFLWMFWIINIVRRLDEKH